jgi:predicted DNA-binding transcriptional regulator AlpA
VKPLLTIDDLATVLGMTPGAIRTARYRNPDAMPPAVKLGNSLRWDPTDVAAFIESRKETATTAGAAVQIFTRQRKNTA